MDRAGFDGIDEERLKRQARGLSYLDAEVVVLVEVPSEEALTFLRDRLEKKYRLEYETLFVAQKSKLYIGVLFKKGVTVKNAELLEGSDLDDGKKRKALTADIKVGKFDFKLVAVHLKSGREKSNQGIRDKQCKVIGDYITGLRGDGDRNPDVLLMGDFNMIPGQDIIDRSNLRVPD